MPSICQCVKQVGFEKAEKERERERERERENQENYSLKCSSQPLLERESTLALNHSLINSNWFAESYTLQ